MATCEGPQCLYEQGKYEAGAFGEERKKFKQKENSQVSRFANQVSLAAS
jgi:hypothetical protein